MEAQFCHCGTEMIVWKRWDTVSKLWLSDELFMKRKILTSRKCFQILFTDFLAAVAEMVLQKLDFKQKKKDI